MSRTLFYRLRARLEQYGPDGVHPKRQRARPGRPPAVSVQTERRVIALAVAWPTCGPQWYSDQLAREGVTIAPVTVWRLLRRQQLGTRRARLAVLERASATGTGLLTERTVKPVRHVAASAPGDLLSLDTFYVGKLKRCRQGLADHGLRRRLLLRLGARDRRRGDGRGRPGIPA
jgi:hypothetical protein